MLDFREVEIINNGTTESQIIVNGQPIMFKGVDRHETSVKVEDTSLKKA